MKLTCNLARVKAGASWRASVITPQGFHWEAACPAHQEALRHEQ